MTRRHARAALRVRHVGVVNRGVVNRRTEIHADMLRVAEVLVLTPIGVCTDIMTARTVKPLHSRRAQQTTPKNGEGLVFLIFSGSGVYKLTGNR